MFKKNGFTTIELLVTVSILAVLAILVIVAINPADLLKQGRDSNRAAGLSAINGALRFLTENEPGTFIGTSSVVYVSIPDTSPTCENLGLPLLPTSTIEWTYSCVQSSSLTRVDGTGWIPVNFQAISAGSPISQLPIDPKNYQANGLYYTYVTSGKLWQLTAGIESQKLKATTFSNAATSTEVSASGVFSSGVYTVGMDFALTPDVVIDRGVSGSQPTFTGIFPGSAYSGGGGFTLIVSGTNFTEDSVVYWNDSALSTNYMAASQLTATVPLGNISSPGTFSVTVHSPNFEGGISPALTFSVTDPGAPWYGANWGYRNKITIDHTKVATTDHFNFPILISRTDAGWRDVSSGGRVGQSDGGDIVFTSSDGTTKLMHEIEKYDPSAGELIAWVNIPTLATAVNTDIYMYYGNDSVADQWNISGTWNNNYLGVWHMNRTGATSTNPLELDSTSGANHASTTSAFYPIPSTDGAIGNAQSFSGNIGKPYLLIGNSIPIFLSGKKNATLSGWMNLREYTDYTTPFEIWSSNTNRAYIGLGGAATPIATTTGLRAGFNAGAYGATSSSTLLVPLNTWVHVATTFDGNGATPADKIKIYFNGVEKELTFYGAVGATISVGPPFSIGRSMSAANRYMNGLVDEFRVSSSTLTSGWIATEYNNQSSPSTFYSVAGEQAKP